MDYYRDRHVVVTGGTGALDRCRRRAAGSRRSVHVPYRSEGQAKRFRMRTTRKCRSWVSAT